MVIFFIWIAFMGLAVGSFINALVWRIHEERNFVTERSMCPKCKHTLSPRDLVPVMSWLLLRGKCRYCHAPISAQYPLVELITGGLFLWTAFIIQPQTALAGVYLAGWLIAISTLVAIAVYDARWQLIPDVFSYVLVASGVLIRVLRILQDQPTLSEALRQLIISLAVSVGLIGAMWAISKGKWMGFGDIYLAAFIGLAFYPVLAFVATIGAFYVGTAFVLPLIIARKVQRAQKLAFAPCLGISIFLVFAYADSIENIISTYFY